MAKNRNMEFMGWSDTFSGFHVLGCVGTSTLIVLLSLLHCLIPGSVYRMALSLCLQLVQNTALTKITDYITLILYFVSHYTVFH